MLLAVFMCGRNTTPSLLGVVGETVYVALELPAIQQQRRGDKAIDLLDRFQRFRVRFHVLDVPHH